MGNGKGCARLEAATDFLKRAQTLLRLDEVQGQYACRSIERSFRSAVDETEMQSRTPGKGAQGRLCEAQHLGRRIDSIERPAGLSLGECLDFETTTSAENKHSRIIRGTLCEKDHDHAL